MNRTVLLFVSLFSVIITDTNIWYKIAEKQISLELAKRLPLAVTALTIIELTSSPKLNNEIGKKEVWRACQAIINANPFYLRNLPYEFAANEYLGKKLKKKISIGWFHNICRNKFNDINIKERIDSRNKRVTAFRTLLMGQIRNVHLDKTIKNQIKQPEKAVDISLNDFLIEIGKATGINSRKVKHKRVVDQGAGLDLYLKARARYNQMLSLEGQQPASNDQFDITNLLYVKMEDLYWTLDKKWLKIITETQMEHKLYRRFN